MSFLKNISNAIASIGNNKTKNNLDTESTEENNIEELEGERLKIAKEQYLKAFPYAENMDIHLWAMPLNFIKMTHNKLGFGKKLIWEK